MGNAGIGGQFDALRVDKNKPYLLGCRTHDDRGQHRVDEAGLTGAGGARHQKMRHLGQVRGNEMAFHILADAGEHRIRIADDLLAAQHVAQAYDLSILVRDLDADGGLAGDRRQDTHVGTGHGISDIAPKIGDLLDLDARAELDLVLGDGRAAQKTDDLGVDLELLECRRQRANHTIVGRGSRGVGLALGEDVEAGQLVWRLGAFGGGRTLVVGFVCRSQHRMFTGVRPICAGTGAQGKCLGRRGGRSRRFGILRHRCPRIGGAIILGRHCGGLVVRCLRMLCRWHRRRRRRRK